MSPTIGTQRSCNGDALGIFGAEFSTDQMSTLSSNHFTATNIKHDVSA